MTGTWTLSLLKVPTSTFTNKNLLSNYCKQVLKHGKLGLSSAKIITDRQLQGSLQTKPKLREGSLTALMRTIGGPSVIITIITWACPDHPALGLCSVCSIFAKYFLKVKLTSMNLNWAFDLSYWAVLASKNSSNIFLSLFSMTTLLFRESKLLLHLLVACYQSIIYTLCFFISRPHDNVNAAVRIGTERW